MPMHCVTERQALEALAARPRRAAASVGHRPRPSPTSHLPYTAQPYPAPDSRSPRVCSHATRPQLSDDPSGTLSFPDRIACRPVSNAERVGVQPWFPLISMPGRANLRLTLAG